MPELVREPTGLPAGTRDSAGAGRLRRKGLAGVEHALQLLEVVPQVFGRLIPALGSWSAPTNNAIQVARQRAFSSVTAGGVSLIIDATIEMLVASRGRCPVAIS